MNDLIQLIEIIPGGIYQDVEFIRMKFKGLGPVSCEKRWEEIKPYIPKKGVVLELGSAEGYFTQKIAEASPDVLVWSIEENKQRAEIQKELLKLKGIKNVALCNYKMTANDLFCLSHTCEGIDLFLALSVFHHWRPLFTKLAISNIAKMIPNLIVEFPQKDISGAEFPDLTYPIMQDQYSHLDIFISRFYKMKALIGSSFLESDEDRPIWLFKKTRLHRHPLNSFFSRHWQELLWGRTRCNRLDYENKKWKLKRKVEMESETYDRPSEPWIPGLNLFNLLQFGMIYPELPWLKQEIEMKYNLLINKDKKPTEIGLKNCLLTPNGVKVIDWDHNDPHYDPDFARAEVEKTIKELTENYEKT